MQSQILNKEINRLVVVVDKKNLYLYLENLILTVKGSKTPPPNKTRRSILGSDCMTLIAV